MPTLRIATKEAIYEVCRVLERDETNWVGVAEILENSTMTVVGQMVSTLGQDFLKTELISSGFEPFMADKLAPGVIDMAQSLNLGQEPIYPSSPRDQSYYDGNPLFGMF